MNVSSRLLLDSAYSEFFDLHRKHADEVGDDVHDFIKQHIGMFGEEGDTTTLQSTQLNKLADLADADHCLLVTLDAMFYFIDDYHFALYEYGEDDDEDDTAHRQQIELTYYIAARNHLLYYGITIPRPGELLGDNAIDTIAELSNDPIKHYLNLDFSMALVEDKLDLLLKIQPTNGPVDYDDYEDEDGYDYDEDDND